MVASIKEAVVKELHRPIRINFKRRHYIQKGIGNTLQADLIILTDIKKYNKGFGYLLTVIDIFSKYAFAVPLKTKSGVEVAKAFEKVLEKYNKNIKYVHTDKGTEFYNDYFKKLMKNKNIIHYSTTTSVKAAIVERFNRTLRRLLSKHFHMSGNYNFIDHIDKLVDHYNNTKHRKIKMAPNKVRKKHEKTLLNTVYNNIKIKLPTDLKVGDYVRISDITGVFRRGFYPNWSTGIYKIATVKNTNPVTYNLIDFNNKMMKRLFYREELQKTNYPDVYLVSKIVQRKGNRVLVNWLGFDNSYNTWINYKDIVT